VTKRVGVEKAAPVSGLRSPVRAVILAIVVVFFPVILVFVLFVKPERLPAEGVAKMGTTASAQALSVAEAGVGLPEGGASAPSASATVAPDARPAGSASAVPAAEPSAKPQVGATPTPRGTNPLKSPRPLGRPSPTASPTLPVESPPPPKPEIID
jgi:hypothetical protein